MVASGVSFIRSWREWKSTSSANLFGSSALWEAPVTSSNRLNKWIKGADVKQESVSLSCPLSHSSNSNKMTSNMCCRVPRCTPSSKRIPRATCWSDTGTESRGLQYTLSSFPFLMRQAVCCKIAYWSNFYVFEHSSLTHWMGDSCKQIQTFVLTKNHQLSYICGFSF